ncbi:MAG: hypothetical protein J6P93_04320, partial [Alphaproteobacteria bacterium]|nr:hypothetical protein [Alphaproteobacteria bacterium]
RFTVPKAFSKSLLDNLPEQVMVLDEYKRGYSIPTSTMIKTTTHSKQAFADNLRSFTMYQKPQTTKLTDTVDMNFSENAKAFSNDAMNGVNLSFNYHKDNITADFSFTQNAKEGTKSYFDQSLRNPFTTSATDVYAFQNGYNLTKELKVGFGASVGKNNFFDGNERVDYRHDKSIKTGELNFDYQPVSYAKVNFTGGILEENGSLLGLNGLGGLKTQDGQTYFMGSQLTVEPTKKVRLSAAYYYGTGGFKKQENALMHLSKVQSESMAFKAEYQFDEDVLFGARAFSPLHIKKAKATFDLPVGRSYTETTVYRERVTANLRPEAKEWDFGVFSVYNMDAWTFQAEALTRLNPENQADMKPDYRLMFSVGFGY